MNPIRERFITLICAGGDLCDLVAEAKRMGSEEIRTAMREELDERGRDALADATSLFCIMAAVHRQESDETDFQEQALPLYLVVGYFENELAS